MPNSGSPVPHRLPSRRRALAALSACICSACARRKQPDGPAISFTRIPQADPGGSAKNDIIEGIVKGAVAGEKIVLYAKSGKWWVQPLISQPITELQKSFNFTNATHLGTHYAALLVKPDYHPAGVLDALPEPGNDVVAVASIPGGAKPPSKVVTFCGYEWRIRDAPSGRGGRNTYDPANAWVDDSGAMHMRIVKTETDWSCAEVANMRSLGYGTYQFDIRDVSKLDLAAVLGLYTYDYAGGSQKSEMDIEIGRWGDPSNKNAQYVVQPYYIPANVQRFTIPPGKLTFTLRWERDQATFRTVRGSSTLAEHAFTSGIPIPGIESIRMVLYYFRQAPVRMSNGSEVVIEQFNYFP